MNSKKIKKNKDIIFQVFIERINEMFSVVITKTSFDKLKFCYFYNLHTLHTIHKIHTIHYVHILHSSSSSSFGSGFSSIVLVLVL